VSQFPSSKRPVQTSSAVSLSYLLIETEAFQSAQDAQARVFANGVQKCVALITVQARNSNGEVVTLQDDLNINVVPYTSATGNWVSSSTPAAAGILPFPEQMIASADIERFPGAPASRPESYQQFRRYISYKDIPDGSVIQFAARVKLPNVEYTSNQRDVPYGGAGQNGRFNSSIRLKSVKSPAYASYNGGLVVTEPAEVFSGLIEGYTAKVENLYLSLRYPGTSTPVNIHSSSSTAAASSLHENKATAFGDSGSSTAKKNVPATNQIGRAMNQALSTIRQPRAGAIALAVAMYSRITEFFTARQTSHYTNGMDVYGNPLRFAVTLTSDRPLRDPWVYQMSIEWDGASLPNAKPPLSSWLTKLTTAVSSPSNRVYPNGRQQMEVTVVIEPLSSQTIKPEELASVKLMVRDAHGQFSPLPESDSAGTPWFFSHARNEYLEYPGGRNTSSAINPSAVYTRKFYVSADTGSAGSMEALYAGITRHTEEGEYDYVTDGSESGFSSSVEVRTAEIPVFQVPGNYTFERTLTAGDGNSDIFTWQYSLAGAGVQQPTVGFVSANMEPSGMIQWDDRDSSVTRASHVGYSSPGGIAFQYNTAIQLGSAFKPVEQVKNPKAGHVTLVLQGGNNIPYHSASAIEHNGPCVLNAVDVYGNNHRLGISFKDSTVQGRHELVLS
jgi:hypothetical protein